jgi:hypothetical protein
MAGGRGMQHLLPDFDSQRLWKQHFCRTIFGIVIDFLIFLNMRRGFLLMRKNGTFFKTKSQLGILSGSGSATLLLYIDSSGTFLRLKVNIGILSGSGSATLLWHINSSNFWFLHSKMANISDDLHYRRS